VDAGHVQGPGRYVTLHGTGTTLHNAEIQKQCPKSRSKGTSSDNPAANGAQAEDLPSETDVDAPVFSLVSGAYKSRRTFHDPSTSAPAAAIEGIRDLTLRNQTFTLAKLESAGSTHLSSRSFQGLEPRLGMDEPAELEQGRGGTARGYTEEK
jgi:diphthamide biosynthesis protein 2